MQEARVARLAPGTAWVDVSFGFKVGVEEGGEEGDGGEDGLVGDGFGIPSFVPGNEESGGGWKVWMLRTMLES